MVKQLMLLALIGLMGMGAGCATLRGSEQKMKIETDPPGAMLTVGTQKYTTPAEMTLKRKEVQKVTVAKDGYYPISFDFGATWDGASLTDVALPGGSALMALSVTTGSGLQFNQLATIKLTKSSEPNPKTMEMYQFRGKLLNKAQYDQAMKDQEQDRSRFQTPDSN